MDAGNLIYIAAVIIYFIYTALKKNKNQDEIDEPSHRPGQPEQKRKPVSFEELLKEIRQGQNQREKEIHPTVPPKQVEQVPSNRDSRPLEKPKAPVPSIAKKSNKYENYEGVIAERVSPNRSKLSEQDRLASTISGIKSSLSLEEIHASNRENRIKSLLRNPRTVKDAVILSEVLNRRYF